MGLVLRADGRVRQTENTRQSRVGWSDSPKTLSISSFSIKFATMLASDMNAILIDEGRGAPGGAKGYIAYRRPAKSMIYIGELSANYTTVNNPQLQLQWILLLTEKRHVGSRTLPTRRNILSAARELLLPVLMGQFAYCVHCQKHPRPVGASK